MGGREGKEKELERREMGKRRREGEKRKGIEGKIEKRREGG